MSCHPLRLTGQRFGRLTAIKPDGRANHFVRWLCKCDCGKTCHARSAYLVNGAKRSCGCLRNDQARINGLSDPTPWKRADEAAALLTSLLR